MALLRRQDIPVTLIVSNTPLLNVPNATLNFTYQSGTTVPPAQTVNITATSGTLSYAVTQSANSPWLIVPNAGTTAAPLSVSVNPAGLAPGTYTATVNVLSATPGSTVQQIPVVLKITNDPIDLRQRQLAELPLPDRAGGARPRRASRSPAARACLSITPPPWPPRTCGSTWLQTAMAATTRSAV